MHACNKLAYKPASTHPYLHPNTHIAMQRCVTIISLKLKSLNLIHIEHNINAVCIFTCAHTRARTRIRTHMHLHGVVVVVVSPSIGARNNVTNILTTDVDASSLRGGARVSLKMIISVGNARECTCECECEGAQE